MCGLTWLRPNTVLHGGGITAYAWEVDGMGRITTDNEPDPMERWDQYLNPIDDNGELDVVALKFNLIFMPLEDRDDYLTDYGITPDQIKDLL